MAIRANIVAAGDNVCRAWLIGSMLAAEQGEHVIPIGWKEQTQAYPEIYALADR